MSYATIRRGVVIAGSAYTLLDCIADNAGEYPTQATLSTTVNVVVTDLDTGEIMGGESLTYDTENVIHDELVVDDPRWKKDRIGYNSSVELSGETVPTRGHTYEVVTTFSPLSGDDFKTVWHIQAI